jgi:thiol:disulfide interchange protein
MSKKRSGMNKTIKNIITIVAIVALVYYGNKGLNTYLGKQAVEKFTFTMYSIDDAKQKAAAEGKLVLADYSAIWCPSCRKLSGSVFANAKIGEQINSDFVYARVDYDTPEGVAFAKTHELVGFPRVLVLASSGERLTEMPLTFDPREYEANLAKVLQAYAQN